MEDVGNFKNLWCLHIEPTNTRRYTVDITMLFRVKIKVKNHCEPNLQRRFFYSFIQNV